MSKPKSNNLFHFTKHIDALKNILLHGLYPRYCLEDVTWFGMTGHVAYPMVCFCDIPLSRIGEHTGFYGSYGIGLTKEWGLKNKLSPVIYCSSDGHIPDVANYLLNLDRTHNTGTDVPFFKLIKHIKPLKGNMFIAGNLVNKEFYQESEWRYIPEQDIGNSVIFLKDFEQEKEDKNKEAENHKLSFSPADIKYIFVKEDADIPTIVDFIHNNMGQFPSNDLKILNSRIVSLQTVESDL